MQKDLGSGSSGEFELKILIGSIVGVLALSTATSAYSAPKFDENDRSLKRQFQSQCLKEVTGKNRAAMDQCLRYHIRLANLWVECSNNGRKKAGVDVGVCSAHKDPMISIYNRCLRSGVKFGSARMPNCIAQGRIKEAELKKRGL